jgi:hypothetical protein
LTDKTVTAGTEFAFQQNFARVDAILIHKVAWFEAHNTCDPTAFCQAFRSHIIVVFYGVSTLKVKESRRTFKALLPTTRAGVKDDGDFKQLVASLEKRLIERGKQLILAELDIEKKVNDVVSEIQQQMAVGDYSPYLFGEEPHEFREMKGTLRKVASQAISRHFNMASRNGGGFFKRILPPPKSASLSTVELANEEIIRKSCRNIQNKLEAWLSDPVGEVEAKVKDLFDTAMATSPSKIRSQLQSQHGTSYMITKPWEEDALDYIDRCERSYYTCSTEDIAYKLSELVELAKRESKHGVGAGGSGMTPRRTGSLSRSTSSFNAFNGSPPPTSPSAHAMVPVSDSSYDVGTGAMKISVKVVVLVVFGTNSNNVAPLKEGGSAASPTPNPINELLASIIQARCPPLPYPIFTLQLPSNRTDDSQASVI